MKVKKSIFTSNRALNIGGVLFYGGNSSFDFDDCKFLRNTSKTYGSVIQGMGENIVSYTNKITKIIY